MKIDIFSEIQNPYADLGIDRLMCFQQVGALPHGSVLSSIRLVGDLIPEFDQ
ncbi:hypothetical protein [Streptomyces sp. NPDC047043]|uniref:hypothetical protein n=1 Tax=Streptomyces sp. NPDC047043 TaxID=3154497 RepID=UPI00340AADD0